MKSDECVSCVLTLVLLLSAVDCSMKKRRLCIEYKKENYFAKGQYITNVYAETENKCMISCVRRHPCMAFNYHVKNKTCILMPAVKCMASTSPNSSWYLFVHLQFCRQLPVWFSVRPADRGWYWVPTDDPSNDTVLVELNSAISIRYVSRTLYRGYYPPGWWRTKDNVFRYADPVTQDVAWCRYGELLAFSNYFLYWWTSYIAGDSLPTCALPVSQLLNGTSLYVVRYNITVETSSSGFYNHVAKSTYIVYGGGVANPLAVDILCEAGTWDLALFVCPLGMKGFFISCWKGWICIYIYIDTRS